MTLVNLDSDTPSLYTCSVVIERYGSGSGSNIAGLPGMFDRTFSCSSLSKANSITGWRIGYVIAASELIESRVH
ncbi:aminotransferase class I/II-fold pyridoxal phosphate-dependent enzyme [Thermodesulfobacteriota bacterium]